MILNSSNCKIWLTRHRVDFRKNHQGLLAEAYLMNLNPFKGDIIIFVGRGRRKIKVLCADTNGLWVCSKVFSNEAMKTKFNFLTDPTCEEISATELSLVIDGSRYIIEKNVSKHTQLL